MSQRETRKEFEPEMVLIPAGPFLMGSPRSDKLRFDDEPEQFELNLDNGYAIGKYPVTVGQYRFFVDAGGYGEPRWWTQAGLKARDEGWAWNGSKWEPTGIPWSHPRFWGESPWTDSDDLPVVGVSWYEVYAYTRWLTEATGRDYRLPTEAEWEKAARGGLQLPDGKGGWKQNPAPARVWPWGDEQPGDHLLNFNGSVGHTTRIGGYPAGASPYGVLDMAGNTWEWCLNKWITPYLGDEALDPQGDALRVVRGGPWLRVGLAADPGRIVRCSYRHGTDPDIGSNYDGCRVVEALPTLP